AEVVQVGQRAGGRGQVEPRGDLKAVGADRCAHRRRRTSRGPAHPAWPAREAGEAGEAATEAATDESGSSGTGVWARSTSTLRPASVDEGPAAIGAPRARPAVSISTSQAEAYSSGGRVSRTSSPEALK